MNAFLMFLYITAFVSFVNCFPKRHRSSMRNSRTRNNNDTSYKKRILERKQEEQKKLKCQYLSKMFPPISENTCLAFPQMLYSEIYIYSYKKNLWEYYNTTCIQYQPSFLDFICNCTILIICLFMIIVYIRF